MPRLYSEVVFHVKRNPAKWQIVLELIYGIRHPQDMSFVNVDPGERVITVNVLGEHHPRRALSGVEVDGHDFPVIWVCREEEWDAAMAEGREPEGVPWPAEDVLTVTVSV